MITSRGYFTGFITPPVKRKDLEYPTVDVTFAYLLAIDKAIVEMHWRATYRNGLAVITVDAFTDKAIESPVRDPGELTLRFVDRSNFYRSIIRTGRATADYLIEKMSAGSIIELGYEAVDLSSDDWYLTRFSVSGSTLKAYRDDLTTPKITVTDTSFTSGKARIMPAYLHTASGSYGARLLAPSSPSSKPIAYFEVPIIGSGTEEDPFRAQLPEEIVLEWSLNPTLKRKYDILKAKGFKDEEILELFPEFNDVKVNRLALTNSALIKTGTDGKPTQYVAILRVFEQPDRAPNLAPIERVLDVLRAMPGVRQLDRETAIREAKRLDDKLSDLDLLSSRELGKDRKQAGKEYMSWRVFNLGIKEELLDLKVQERYAEEDKGW